MPILSRGLTAAVLACAVVVVSPIAVAQPGADADRAEVALERAQARLATLRAQLEEAEQRHAEATDALERRLVEEYVSPTPDGLAALLTGGAPDALSRLDVLEARSREDAAMLRRHETALAAREAAVERLAQEQARLAAKAERARDDDSRGNASAAAASTDGPPEPETIRSAQALSAGDDRAELERLVGQRRLPGDAPTDSGTGERIELDPVAAAPEPLIARPYRGLDQAPLRTDAPSGLAVGWYGPGYADSVTASGERYDPDALSAASRTLPFGTLVRLEHRGRSVTVRVNDRGPYGRAQDLAVSDAAARELDLRGIEVVSGRRIVAP